METATKLGDRPSLFEPSGVTPQTLDKDASRSYLDHLDGLRCIAVITVLLFHARIPGFSGGYVGVDIFFAISGFLMTRILANQDLTRSALSKFFKARFYRIYPTYICVIVAAAVASSVYMLPIHLLQISSSFLSAPFFLTNFVFYKTTSYFSPDITFNPILHTWSLGVEWQFYIFYPLAFLLASRARLSNLLVLAALTAVSLALAVAAVQSGKTIAAFYLLPTRIWEFTIGGIAALLAQRVAILLQSRPRLRLALSLASLASIAACVVFYNERTPFPGLAAVPPCVATAVLILTGNSKDLPGRFLTNPVSRLIGLSSYSIYLWHWPIIVFADYRHASGGFTAVEAACIVLLSLLLGLLSWKFIEKPFRKRAQQDSLRTAVRLGVLGACTAAVLAFSPIAVITGGFPKRFESEVNTIANAYGDAGRYRSCLSRTPLLQGDQDAFGLCRIGKTTGNLSFIVLGDSHATSLADGISELAEKSGRSGILSASDACAPLLDFPGMYPPTRLRCRETQAAMKDLILRIHPEIIVLHAAWPSYFKRNPELFSLALAQTLDWLKSQSVKTILIADTPGAPENVPIGLAKERAFGTPFVSTSTDHQNEETRSVNQLLAKSAAAASMNFIDITDNICISGAACKVTLPDGYPLYWDNAHLTSIGSKYVAELMTRRIQFLK